MAIQSSPITTTGTTIFTCPGTLVTDEQEYAVTCIMFCNNSPSSQATLTLHIVNPSPTAVDNTNMVINQLVIPAGETFSFDTEKVVLNTGDRIYAISSINPDGQGRGLNSTVSYMRVS